MTDLIDYRMEIVGGPFDGAQGLRWRDDGEHPPPGRVLLGVCPGNGSCNSFASIDCAEKRRPHTYFWLVDEREHPTRVTLYELQDSFIEPEEMENLRVVPGRAIYAIGGLLLPPEDELQAERREERELAVTGHAGGGLYASDIVRSVCREHGIELGR